MKLLPQEIKPIWLLLIWCLLNLLQAAFTPLDADETYYWMYAGQLDWGYFDHPPAVAVLIALGRDWLPGSLGLRFGHVLASTLMVGGMWHLLGKPRGGLLWLAAALIAAQPFFNVYGFIATPDGPLLLFSVLYLLAYRRFLGQPGLANGALWGITMAGLLYSKYHGVVLILLTVLPHLFWLLRQPGAWVAALGGAALYVPHLFWQYTHDFPSFRYHLSGRNDPYEFKFTLEYLLNQLVIFSPLLVYHYVLTFVRDRKRTPAATDDRFALACRWLVVGFLVFFLYTTTKGGTEAQWTALLSIPLVYLLFRAVRGRFPAWQPRVFRLSLITIGILLFARLLLLAPRTWLPFEKPFDHQPWTERLADQAGDLPLLVQNSYQLSSLYQFYTGKPAWTFTDVQYRRNQYDLWEGDSVFHNQPVLLLGQNTWESPQAQPFRAQKRNMRTEVIDSFQVTKGVRITTMDAPPTVLRRGTTAPLSLVVYSPRNLDLKAGNLPLRPYIIFHFPDGTMDFYPLELSGATKLVKDNTVRLTSGAPIMGKLPAGPARVELGLGYRGMPPLRGQSKIFDVEIE